MIQIRLTCLTALLAFASISACETTPTEPVVTLPATMTETSFNSALASAKAYRNPYQADRQLSAMIDRSDLTSDMRAQALYARGNLRRLNGNNRNGALKDFDEMLRLSPNHSLASNARTERSYTQTDISKIKSNMQYFLNISQWFDGAWALGDHQKAANRYQKSGLSPTAQQVQTLVDAGYLCTGNGAGGKLYKYGDMRSDLQNKFWCRSLPRTS